MIGFKNKNESRSKLKTSVLKHLNHKSTRGANNPRKNGDTFVHRVTRNHRATCKQDPIYTQNSAFSPSECKPLQMTERPQPELANANYPV